MKNKKIIYIIGDSRSGTTLLENVMAKSQEIISVGELRNLGDHIQRSGQGKAWNWNCSCGQSLFNCVFWSKLLNDLKDNKVDINQSTKIVKNTNGNTHKTLIFLNEVYGYIFNNFKHTNFIIDSSKLPYQGYKIYKELSYDVKIIYLKRDVRAVSLSKQRWIKKKHGIVYSIYRKLISTILARLKCNKFYNKVCNADKILIHYEDMSKNMDKTIKEISDKFNIKSFEVPTYMYLNDDHTIGGSPNRFQKRKIKYDDSWEQEIKYKPLFRVIGKILNYL